MVQHTIEIVVAKWSTPALVAHHELERWLGEHKYDATLIVHDHDTTDFVQDDPAFEGWGECRLNGGPWMKVPDLLEQLA